MSEGFANVCRSGLLELGPARLTKIICFACMDIFYKMETTLKIATLPAYPVRLALYKVKTNQKGS